LPELDPLSLRELDPLSDDEDVPLSPESSFPVLDPLSPGDDDASSPLRVVSSGGDELLLVEQATNKRPTRPTEKPM